MQVTDEMVRAALDRYGSDDYTNNTDAMRAALTAALAAMWRPASEAKKDGTEYLCFVPGLGLGQMVLYWSDGYWREKANGMGLRREPEAIIPLPSPPTQTGG